MQVRPANMRSLDIQYAGPSQHRYPQKNADVETFKLHCD